MQKLSSIVLAIASVFLISTPAKVQAADIINGSFEAGDLSNWQIRGQTTVENAGFGVAPVDGTYQAILETLQDNTGISSSEIENFLGLSPSVLTNLGVVEGSAIRQTITVDAGDILSFSWNFLTDQEPAEIDYNDFGFLSISNSVNQLADTYVPSNFSFSRLSKETGYQSYSYNFLTAGTYTLGFGVVDVGDSTINSALVVDNIKLTKASKRVPEPSTMLGYLIFLGCSGVFIRKSTSNKRIL